MQRWLGPCSLGHRTLLALSIEGRFQGCGFPPRALARMQIRLKREAGRAMLCVPTRKGDHMPISSQIIERCIEDCLQCIRWCSQARDESLTHDPATMRECIRLCGECLELCRSCVVLLAGSSPFAHRLCGICADLCDACATECEKYKMETMRKSAEACRRCAAACREVAQAGPIRRAAP